MHTSKIWHIVSLSAVAMLMPLWATAQQEPAKTDTPAAKTEAPAPKKLEKLEEGEPPSIKVGKPEEKQKVTETRDESGVKEVKVQTGSTTYYIKPDQQVGDSLPGDVQSTHNHGVQFKVMEFDLGSKNKSKKSDDSGSAQPAPKDGTVTDEPKK
jgi:hypothetical protein